MKLNVLAIARTATAFGALAASAQTTVIEERRESLSGSTTVKEAECD